MWSNVKGYVASNNKTLKLKKVRQLLDIALTFDGLTDNMVDRLLINVGKSSSDSESDMGVAELSTSDSDSE
ncbi:hypothetical protein ANN_18928 [Periplaneta americana]|uniref:Uncharacterized protein n=1 Tax=Periplaneta americana TaxID=6978 RepID=A0ABQ8SRM6_PERAM|nr:hypothetical protein ANN_18928 [Periplaneta americana]